MGLKTTWLVWCVALSITAGITARAQQPPQRLTLQDAVNLALKQNLSVRMASAQLEESEGITERRKSSLLPHVNADAFANRQNVDLAALGISFPEIPMVVPAFNHYDFRVSASQSLIDRRAYHTWKASEKLAEADKLDYQDARDLVIRQTAGLYLASEADAAAAEAAQSRVATSETLEKLARDQHALGLATGVDVVRAQVQLARDQQSVLVARNGYQTSLLALARFLGLRPGTPIELAQALQFHHIESTDAQQALQSALESRPDYIALLKERDSLKEQLKAAHARYLPTLSVNGDYGAIGPRFQSLAGTGEIQGTVTVSVFDRDRTGEKVELQSQLKRLDAQLDDLNHEIDEEIRKASLDLESTEAQVNLTEATLQLALHELSLAQDRFRNGVTDNIEVITAQSSLAGAEDDRIAALAQHADAVMALVRALGGTEKTYRQYLGEP